MAEILKSFCEDNGIAISDEQNEKFEKLTDLLLEFNSHTNLTAIKEPDEVAVKHYADSVAPLAFNIIPKGARVCDIGCGAGFPGLPLCIMRDDISLTFVDSTAKKLRFTKSAIDGLELGDQRTECLAVRAEELVAQTGRREGYDVVVSRAVAALPVLCELCIPFVKRGGIFIAYKASGAPEELKAAKKAIATLGGVVHDIKNIELPECKGEPQPRTLVIIRKEKQTPVKFPRSYAKIVKSPL